MDVLISVVIPVYKVEEYLNRCVTSVLNQTYSNIEVILVNDGSPDNCGKMCDEFAEKDKRVTVIHKENGGLSSARNAGIEIAKGEYLSFLDSDDWVEVTFIEKALKLLVESKADIAITNYMKIYNEREKINNDKIEKYEFSNLEALNALAGKFNTQITTAWGKIYHRDIFDKIRYPIGKIHEDEFVIHHILNKADKVVLTTEKLLYYWQRKDSITGSGFKLKNKLHVIEALKDRIDLLNELNLEKAIEQTYRSIFINYRQIYEHRDNLDNKDEIIQDFKALKTDLRKGKYDLKFKVAYELYYLFPSLMKKVFDTYIDKSKQ
ncbi:MAG: glycosyltransferase family 2 protein [Epulopiscium sp.]|nr:glycosyltransferase family 2 protein [Candidatus Epulonipiscium sp.]